MFGRGKIEIEIQKMRYVPGDTISGAVTLTLNKPLKAREMTLSLIGEYKTIVTDRVIGPVPLQRKGNVGSLGVGGRMLQSDEVRKIAPIHYYERSTKNVQIYGFKEQLDGEIEYNQTRRYQFQIKITADMPTSSVVNWYLLAKLDIPHGRDITQKTPITIV
jgi:sporulation-control protein spo0M